jgi:hypothetical protein
VIPVGVQIFVALAPVDMRYSFDRLAGIAAEQTGYDPRSGAMFIFFGKRRSSAGPVCRQDGVCSTSDCISAISDSRFRGSRQARRDRCNGADILLDGLDTKASLH